MKSSWSEPAPPGECTLTAEEILLQAAEEVAKGWCQGGLHDTRDNSVCAIGALNRVTTGSPRLYATSHYIEHSSVSTAFEAMARYAGDSIVDWNDAEGRTAEDVILGFKTAAHNVSLTFPVPIRGYGEE